MSKFKSQWNVRIDSNIADQVREHCSHPGSPGPGDFTEAALTAHLMRVSGEGTAASDGDVVSPFEGSAVDSLGERFQSVVLRVAQLDARLQGYEARIDQLVMMLVDVAESTQALAREVRLSSAVAGSKKGG